MKLKKSQKFTIAAAALAALLLTAVLVIGLNSDGFHLGGTSPAAMNFHNEEVIPLGEEDTVDIVEVSWVSGPVTLGKSPDSSIHVVERASREIRQEDAMQAAYSGGKLTVRWDGQWFRKWINWSIFSFGRDDKALEVLLPGDGTLAGLNVSNTSGDITIADFSAEELNVSSTSGNLILSAVSGTQSFHVSTVSGDVRVEGAGAGELNASTTSGSLELKATTAQELHISTTSGSCQYTGAAQELKASTVSGELLADLTQCPAQAAMESVSGSVRLGLPENDGFTAVYSSVSGDFQSDFPTTGSVGKRDGTVVYGTGSAKLRFSTTSGEIAVSRTKAADSPTPPAA